MERDKIKLEASTKWIVAATAAIALSSLATLVLVATIQDADALSTVSMALAILAFIAQLLQAAADGMSANQQMNQVTDINKETRVALAEIRASTGDILARRDQHFEQLLQSVIPGAVAQSLSEADVIDQDADPERFASRVLERALEQYDSLSQAPAAAGVRRATIDELLAHFPDLAKRLRDLPAAQEALKWQQLNASINSWHGLTDRDIRARMDAIIGSD